MKLLGTHPGHYDGTGEQIDGPIDLVQFNLVATPQELRRLAKEFISAAQTLERTDQDHIHLSSNADFIICRKP